ncbi:MAG: MFS transporter, partial [Solimonas sp.]
MSNGQATPLRRDLLIAFTLPTLVLGVMHGPEGQIQAVYAKHAGLSLTVLATAMLLTKMFDAITYPLIGYFSDRSHARSGTRRSWVIAGAVLSVIGIWYLLRPPKGVGVLYFGAWTAVTYLGWKIIEIPLQAWSYGLSADYAQRARVQAWRALAQVGGLLLFFVIPFIAVQAGYSDSTELDFRSLGFAALICVVALPLATLIMVLRVRGGNAAAAPAQRRFGSREMLAAVGDNKPLLRLLAAFLPVNLLTGVMNGVAYFYMDTYLGLGKQFPVIMLVALLATIIGIPVWTALSARHERHRVWALCLVAGGLACAGLAFASPGPLALPLSFLLYTTILFCLSSSVIAYTMSADIVDYGRLHTGQDHGGLYAAFFAFLQKSLLGVSTAAGVALVGAFGFDATASVQTASGVLGIKLAGAIIPAAGLLGAAALIWNYPLTRARIAEVQAA